MTEFFRGWKRKIGVVTLLMACVAMLVWVDNFNGDLTFGYEHCGRMESGNTSIGIYQHSLELRETRNTYRTVSLAQAVAADDVKINKKFEELNQSSDPASPASLEMPEPRQDVLSVDGDSPTRKGFNSVNLEAIAKEEKVFSLPLWSITIPLTVLSAFLLLTKPQKSTPNKINEPVQGEGGGAAS